MLTSHPHIAIPPEGGFIIRLGWKYDRIHFTSQNQIDRFLVDLYKSENIQDWEINKNDLRERLFMRIPCSYPVLIGEIYRAYNDQKFSGVKRRWGDKTTWYGNYLSQIQSYFPNMVVIHLVRDARAVASSYKGVPHLPDDVVEITLEWVWFNHLIEKWKNDFLGKRYYLIRYEDLVRDPEDELRSLCDFLQEPYDEEMINFWIKNREQELEPERHLGWKIKTLEKVTTDQIDHWKTILPRDEILTIEMIGRSGLQKYGYALPESSPPILKIIYYKIRQMFYIITRSLKRILREKRERFFALAGIRSD